MKEMNMINNASMVTEIGKGISAEGKVGIVLGIAGLVAGIIVLAIEKGYGVEASGEVGAGGVKGSMKLSP